MVIVEKATSRVSYDRYSHVVYLRSVSNHHSLRRGLFVCFFFLFSVSPPPFCLFSFLFFFFFFFFFNAEPS